MSGAGRLRAGFVDHPILANKFSPTRRSPTYVVGTVFAFVLWSSGGPPALGILELRVCDPSMGSGHFLVNLVDWLADKALAAIAEAELIVDWSDKPYRSPVLASIEQTRTDIIRQATVHKWPFAFSDASFDHSLSMLVLHFIPQTDLAVREMRRVTRPGGTVAAATWDTRGGPGTRCGWGTSRFCFAPSSIQALLC